MAVQYRKFQAPPLAATKLSNAHYTILQEDGTGEAVEGKPKRSSTSSSFLKQMSHAEEGSKRKSVVKRAGRQTIHLDPDIRCSEEEKNNAMRSGAKAVSTLMKMELEGYCNLEQGSVYGAAVALPQIARCVGWPKQLVGLSVRVYVLLVLNIFLQGILVCFINEEALVMNPFGGQMHLCDFGANLDKCPWAHGCSGPQSTVISGSRLKPFDIWSTNMYFRQALSDLFPERHEDIADKVDPGEYGMANYWCRLVCLFLFMMGVVDDLAASVELAVLTLFVPSEDGYWISYDTPFWTDKETVKAIHDMEELDFIRFHVAGMPVHWKVCNILTVLLPKFFLWYSVTAAGFRFLMETPAIMDLIVNCMALTFILDIDELLIDRFATVATKHIMQNVEAFPLFNSFKEEAETPEQAYQRIKAVELSPWTMKDLRLYWLFLPKKLAITIALMVVFLNKYYYTYCYREEDGTWVSKDMYAPKGVYWDPVKLFFTALYSETEPYWSFRD